MYGVCEYQRLRADCAEAQADLNLCRLHMRIDTFSLDAARMVNAFHIFAFLFILACFCLRTVDKHTE